ncbi:MAG: hypothetical protein E7353_08455 [Clostridiales bacterium]|nr:hypothetical protein [Clostridiales bacterium]
MTYFFLSLLVVSIVVLVVLSTKGESVGFEDNKPDYFTLAQTSVGNHRSKLLIALCVKKLNKSVGVMKKRDKLFEYENWLYDNAYKVKGALRSLKKLKISSLPSHNAMPRLYYILKQCINENSGKLDEWEKYIQKFNNYGYLRYEETVALRDMARYVLCEFLTIYYSKSYVARMMYLKGKREGITRKIDFHSLKYASYLLGLLQTLDSVGEKRLKKLCEDNGIDLYGKISAYKIERDEYCVKVKNAVLSLANVYGIMTNYKILNCNKVSLYLEKSEVFYKDNDDNTKLEYLRLIAKKSKRNNQMAYAIKSVSQCKKSGEDLYEKLSAKSRSSSFYLLLFLLRFSFALIVCIVVGAYFSTPVFAVLFFPVVYMFIKHVCRFLVQKPASFTPRVKQIKGQTVIVISALITSKKDAQYAVTRAKTVKRANPKIDVCLLVDLKDAKNKTEDSDKEILQTLKVLDDGIYCAVRERRFTSKGYIAWEKKRGAILELFEYILTKKADFAYCNLPSVNYDYAITLDIDSDIILAERAIRAIEHPYFKDVSVLSFSSFPALASRDTLYAKLFTDKASGYSFYGYTLENDVFHKGNYTGKGVCRIKDFYERVSNVFPDNKILSHDFIEGAMSGCRNCDVAVSENAPQTLGQDLARESRWIRGDWQLLPYLLPTIKDRYGKNRKNRIGIINKAHILANLCSSLYPIFLLASLLFARGYLVLLALSLPLFSILVCFTEIIFAPKKTLKNVVRQVYELAVLPYKAWVCLYSVAVTIVRLIRNKKLLEWKTFRHTLSKNYAGVFCVPLAIITFVFAFLSLDVGLFVVGIIFLSGTFSFVLDEKKPERKISTNVRKTALDLVNATSAYFLNSLEASSLFLIPDFYSEENGKYSNMTSPTNIGFSLVALRCMYKLGFIKRDEFVYKSDKILKSIESLKKYRGHLYNWYDINTGEPLYPRYVSTVDSGNFCMSLCFVMSELSEKSREIAERFIQNIKFDFLVNSDKKLLVTGFCDATKKTDESCYDLFASESLLTYIFCVGYNKISGECAFSLDGSATHFYGNTLYSWTGGAFEYLMTSLFIPYTKGSSLYRSAVAHTRAQSRYSLPFWGISESQYNAYDDSGNRKYKAFGIEKTAYKSAMGSARAPYASALCLEFAPEKVVNNLKIAEKWGMRGKLGLYEAYDGEVIKTYMAHHQGMIMLALYNVLDNNAYKVEFANSPEILSALLYFQVPEKERREHKQKEAKLKIKDVISIKSENVYATNIMRNKTYSVMYQDNGESEAFYKQQCVFTKGGNDIVLTLGSRSYSLLAGAKCALDESASRYVIDNQFFRASVTITALSSFDGEIREVEITNKTNIPQTFALSFYVEPVLLKKEEYTAHKTYSKMFILPYVLDNCVMAKSKHFTLAMTCDKEDTKEVDRGKIFRKSSSKINVDCCLFTSKHFSLESEKSVLFYNALFCAKTTLLSQNLANVFEKTDKNTLMELSRKQTLSTSVGENIKNIISSVSKNVGKKAEEQTIILDCVENNLYRLKEVASALILASRFSPRFIAYVVYSERDGYFKSVGNMAREEVERARCEEGNGNVRFEFLEKSMDKEKIESISKLAISPLSNFLLYSKKPMLMKKCEEETKVNLPHIIYPTDCGGFYKDGFLINKAPPKTWSNVVSNGNVGFIATEYGGGYTFYSSSRQEKITEFSFDPLKNSVSEGVVFCEDNLVWSASSSPCGTNCYCMNESGKTTYKTGYNGIAITQKVGVGGSNKFIVINLKNTIDKMRKIYVTFFARIVLGDFVENTENCITYAKNDNVLRAKNVQNGMEVHLSSSENIVAYSFDTKSMLAKNGEIVSCKDFTNERGRNGFVCTVCIDLDKEKQVVFSLGKNPTPDFSKAEDIIEDFCALSKDMSAVKIHSGDNDLDCVFPWLIPQTYFSRFMARCGFYQVGGAYGFRDQLQDCLALLYSHPGEVREHILYCAQRQFESGDVLHWWHHPYTGVRTRISDDKLFLPYVTAKYIAFTGDKEILNEQVALLKDVAFDKVLYTNFAPTEYKITLKDHIIRAIHSCKFAPNGLVLMGDGDWNDAMDNAGSKGVGSSVWLSMFLYAVINECKEFLDNSDFYNRILNRLRESVIKMFDGNSFSRLITDDGVQLGHKDGFVDIITQSWATLSGIADEKTCITALQSAKRLVDDDKRIIKLLAPPFDKDTKIGSIGKYPKGVRENGGQYTHGAVWYVMALFKQGQVEEAYKCLRYLLPSTHCVGGNSSLYKNEPYVISADVYESGEAGWSWYTGSSSWMYILIVEYLLGIKKSEKTVRINPALPKSVEKMQVSLCFDGISMEVEIDNTGDGEWRLFYQNVRYETDVLMLDIKNHGKKFRLARV